MTDLPAPFQSMLNAWNEPEPDKIRSHLDKALSADVEFCDPNYHITGIDAFEQMIREFKAQYPTAKAQHTSGLDHHHNRYRYAWLVSVDGDPVVPGLDVATVDDDGKVCRIDGFFGDLPAL
ncbi:MAG: hypothetical protein AAF415_09705 [Pseudomonadota bacterium]